MKTFLKTLIGGALGLGALYVVGKICYEAGKDEAEIERQLRQQLESEKPADPAAENDNPSSEGPDGEENPDVVYDKEGNVIRLSDQRLYETLERAQKNMSEAIDEAVKKNTRPTTIGKLTDKVRNAKMFIRVKRVFEKNKDRSPGILGSLLANPDGAKIEAFVKNGGVQINVTPRTA